MARKIRDGALYIFFNAMLVLQCRDFFNIDEWLETRIFFIAFAATLFWYATQTYLTERVNDKEKKTEREEEKNKCPFSNFGYGQCEMFPDFICPLHKDDQENCTHKTTNESRF